MKHLGDITKISGYEVPIVDVVVGGSPCQDLSVAGKREGLAGERSGLFMEQLRIIKEMRDGVSKELRSRGSDEYIRPRYMVWENVPGAFSSNKGEDFRVVLEETARVADKTAVIPKPEGGWKPSGAIMGDGWSIAWRVHDAQFWGVPQRRKRIALVADFGGATAPEILFEREGVPRDFKESGKERKGTASVITENTGDAGTISFLERAGCDGGVKESSSNTSEQEHSQHSTTSQCCLGTDVYNLQTTGDVAIDRHAVCIGNGQLHDAMRPEEISKTLNCMVDPMKVVTYGIDRAAFNQGENAQFGFSVTEEQSPTIVAKGPGGGIHKTVGALCARDHKGVGNQYVSEGKLVIQNILKDCPPSKY